MGQAEEESVGDPRMKSFTLHSIETRAGLLGGRATYLDEAPVGDSSGQ